MMWWICNEIHRKVFLYMWIDSLFVHLNLQINTKDYWPLFFVSVGEYTKLQHGRDKFIKYQLIIYESIINFIVKVNSD